MCSVCCCACAISLLCRSRGRTTTLRCVCATGLGAASCGDGAVPEMPRGGVARYSSPCRCGQVCCARRHTRTKAHAPTVVRAMRGGGVGVRNMCACARAHMHARMRVCVHARLHSRFVGGLGKGCADVRARVRAHVCTFERLIAALAWQPAAPPPSLRHEAHPII